MTRPSPTLSVTLRIPTHIINHCKSSQIRISVTDWIRMAIEEKYAKDLSVGSTSDPSALSWAWVSLDCCYRGGPFQTRKEAIQDAINHEIEKCEGHWSNPIIKVGRTKNKRLKAPWTLTDPETVILLPPQEES